MELPEKNTNRKRFLQWGAALLGSVTLFRFFKKPKPTKQETVKMLTADGRLVEVNAAAFNARRKRTKASKKEIYAWMNNPSKQ